MPPVIENPSDFKVDGAPTSTSITVSWAHSGAAPLTGFHLWHRKQGETGWGEPADAGGEERRFTIDGLQPGTSYELRIQTYVTKSGGKELTSDLVGPITAATMEETVPEPGPLPKPHAPWGLKVDGFVSPQTVPLHWSYDGADPDHFVLFSKPSWATAWSGPAWVDGHKRYQDVWDLPNAPNGGTFDFRLAAVDAAGTWSEDVRLLNVALPYKPMGKALPYDVRSTEVGRTSLTIKWEWDSLRIGGFKVYYRPDGNDGSWTLGGESLFVDHDVHITGLKPATKYVVRVYGWVWSWGKTYYSNPSTDMTASTAA